jgi:Tol biopolymer transport system component
LTRGEWQQVWGAFQNIAELPPAERGDAIEKALADEHLKAKLQELLDGYERGADTAQANTTACHDPAGAGWFPLVGRSVGRFELRGPIGRGGMGEVYRAFDPELEREVAIKFIVSSGLGSTKAIADLLREARAASALNHPGIVTVFEVIRDGDFVAIVMELVEGRPLRSLMAGPHPLAQVALWGQRIAEGLAATHALGILHRDIKPENLIVRDDGYVKILDFGLAARRASETSSLPVGTVRYMSPEQARGVMLTPATDIFSLGVVLYEAATGVHPFAFGARSNTTLSIVFAVTAQDFPTPSAIVLSLPRAFDSLIAGMLDKDPARRPSAAEVAEALRSLPSPKAKRRRIAAGVILSICVVLAVIGFRVLAVSRLREGAPSSPRTLDIVPFTTSTGQTVQPTFSPDGSRIAFMWAGPDGGNQDIYWQAIGEPEPHRLTTDPAEDFNPVYSPDGRWIAFFRATDAETSPRVVVVPAEGGAERVVGRVTRLSTYRGMDWWPDGKSLLVRDIPGQSPAVVRLFLEDGRKVQFSFPAESEGDSRPVVSPDRTRVAFVRTDPSASRICWTSVAGGPAHCGVRSNGVIGMAWHRNSHAIYYSDSSALCLTGLDDTRGGPSKLADGAFRDLASDRTGTRLAFSRTVSDSNIWRMGRDGKGATRLVASSGHDVDPAWSPDGSQILVRSNRSGKYQLYVYNADGSGGRQITHFGAVLSGGARWSPDGKWIAFDGEPTSADPSIRRCNIYVVPSAGGQIRRMTDDGFDSRSAAWSPDGQWIYYCQSSQPSTIQKVALSGGPSVTVGPAMWDMVLSSDGRYFYFTNLDGLPGIWRRPVAGGKEELLPGTESVHLYRYWDLTRGGIFFVEGSNSPVLRFLDLRSGRTSSIGKLPPQLFFGPRCLSAMPDGTAVAYSLVDVTLGNIMLIKNP